MNFFTSIFSEEPQDPRAEKEGEENLKPGNPEPPMNTTTPDSPSGESSATGLGGWNWSFIKTISARSEQVIESYRRDLDEFRVGLAQEARTVADNLPATLEVGASIAQESLESVGQAIDVVFKGTTDIISQALDNPSSSVATGGSNSRTSVKKFTRFEMHLHTIRNDYNTFSEDPDDVEEFRKWISGFSLEDRTKAIEQLFEENAAVGDFFQKLVPKSVDAERFWARYFFRVDKLKQAEESRARLVRRVISKDEDEDLSWEIDDDDAVESVGEVDLHSKNGDAGSERIKEASSDKVEPLESELGFASTAEDINSKRSSSPGGDDSDELSGEVSEGKSSESGVDRKGAFDERTLAKERADAAESIKDSDFSVVSCQSSVQEEEDDIEWDEIEDLGSNDEKKTETIGERLKKIDIRKRLNADEEEDEDLSWDMEGDEDVKS